MKIALTSHGKNWEDKMDSRFGRADGFLLFDDQTDELSWHDNKQNINASHGAGIQAGQNIADLGVEVLITGHVGPKAFKVLNAASIKMFIDAKDMTIKEAYEKYKNGNLKMTDGANSIGLG